MIDNQGRVIEIKLKFKTYECRKSYKFLQLTISDFILISY